MAHLPRSLRWRRLSVVQRILVQHIILMAGSLLIGHIAGYAWLAAAVASIITLWTVSRLLAQPRPGVVLARALEPLLIIWSGLLNLQLIGHYLSLNSQVVAIVLTVLLLWQARFFLIQFDPTLHVPQSGHTLGLMWLSMNALTLLLLESPTLFGITLDPVAVLGIVLATSWLIQYAIAHFWLERIGFHNSFVAAAWALLVTQLVWLTSFAVVVYQLPVVELFVTRLSLMVLVMGYAWGSMLRLHSQRLLSKKLVVEYGSICSVVLGILIFLPVL